MKAYKITYTKSTYYRVSGELIERTFEERYFSSLKKAEFFHSCLELENAAQRKESLAKFQWFNENIQPIKTIIIEK
jgi:folate-dependent tRNA-U54 methylase TrmFO/GidA